MARTKRKTSEIKPTHYCRKCMKMKELRLYYTAMNEFIDSNGYMSVCKDCINEIYDSYLLSEGSMEIAIMRMCKLLDIPFDMNAVEATKLNIATLEENGRPVSQVFGIYKARLSPFIRNSTNLHYAEPDNDVKQELIETTAMDQEYLDQVWGKGLNTEDYEFLEREYSEWIAPIGSLSHSEEVLIRDICHLQNQIRRARIENDTKRVETLTDSRQKLMKDAAQTPALQSAASAGRNAECFGNWIRDIENMRPAEWFEDQKKLSDMDGMEADMADIRRSIKNFMTESRDFNVKEMEGLAGILDMED